MDVEARDTASLRRLETAGAVGVAVAGALLHFVYGWSGENRLVAALVPVNESVWEHLKMVVLPVLALGALGTALVEDRRRLWWAKLVEVVAASGFIVAFFYTYTGALGVDSVAVDVASFFVAVAGGQWLSYRILVSPRGRAPTLTVSLGALALVVVGFGALTFAPPHLPLFHDDATGQYGAD